MSDVLALSREQGEEAARAVLAALLAAGPDGLAPGEAVARSGLSERRWRRAVDRLESEGRVRRDGKRRVFAVATAAGELVPANDAASVAERARAEARDLAYRRGWVLGEVEDVRGLLDLRRMPAPAGGRARAARDYLAELARDVRDVGSAGELEALVSEFSPVRAEVAALLTAVEGARLDVTRQQSSAAGALVEVEAEARRWRALVTELDRWAGRWERQAWVAFGALADADAQVRRRGLPLAWSSVEHWQAEVPRVGKVGTVLAVLAAGGRAYSSRTVPTVPELPGHLNPDRTRVRVWSAWDASLAVECPDVVGHLSAPPAALRLAGRWCADVADAAGDEARRQLGGVEARLVELRQARTGGQVALGRAVQSRLGAAPMLDGAGPLRGIGAR